MYIKKILSKEASAHRGISVNEFIKKPAHLMKLNVRI